MTSGSPLRYLESAALEPFAAILFPLIIGGLPVVNIVLAVFDGRALARGEQPDRWILLRWLMTLLNVAANLFLLALVLFIVMMLINGPGVA